jgi:sRNA-binding regulator protein Hfq
MRHNKVMKKLTKQALTRLQETPVKVKLWNGCFNVASVEAKFSRYSIELRVETTNPLLKWQCGNKNEVALIYWKSGNGQRLEVPAELNALVGKLRAAGTMSNEEAAKLLGL